MAKNKWYEDRQTIKDLQFWKSKPIINIKNSEAQLKSYSGRIKLTLQMK